MIRARISSFFITLGLFLAERRAKQFLEQILSIPGGIIGRVDAGHTGGVVSMAWALDEDSATFANQQLEHVHRAALKFRKDYHAHAEG
jgi:hypothetical protein